MIQPDNDEKNSEYLIKMNLDNKRQLQNVEESLVYLRSQWIAESLPVS